MASSTELDAASVRAAPRALLPLVFLAGIGSMATEICASRLLAPFYGSSTVVWAEHHRPHPGGIGGRLLARRSHRRRSSARPPARLSGDRWGRSDRRGTFRGTTVPSAFDRRHRASVGGRRSRLVLCLAAALRPASRAPWHGHALRHQTGRDRGRHSRRDCGAHLRPLHFWQHTRHLHPGADHDSAHRHPAQPSRGSGDRRLRRCDTVAAALASRCRCTHPAVGGAARTGQARAGGDLRG